MKTIAQAQKAHAAPITSGTDHPTTLVLSMHKGASTFISADLAPRMCRAFKGLKHIELGSLINRGSSYEDLAVPEHGVVVSRVYPDLVEHIIERPSPIGGRFHDKKIVMLRRDPRDAIVSLYYSVAYSHDPRNVRRPERWLKLREQLRADGLRDGIKRLINRAPIKEFKAIGAFAHDHSWALMTDYETLVTDPDAWLERVASYLGWDDTQLDAVGKGLAESVRPPQEEQPDQHKRRVRPGNWREVFDDELETMFRAQVGRELDDAGYTW